MMESGYFNNGNFREYFYFAGGFCTLETGIPGGPAFKEGVIRRLTPEVAYNHTNFDDSSFL